MDTKAAITKLYTIVAKQQGTITKLAQAVSHPHHPAGFTTQNPSQAPVRTPGTPAAGRIGNTSTPTTSVPDTWRPGSPPKEGDRYSIKDAVYVFQKGQWVQWALKDYLAEPAQQGVQNVFPNPSQNGSPIAAITSSPAIKQLFNIVAKQNEAIKALAQMAGAAPVAAPAQAPGEDLSAKLQAALFGAQPGIQAAFIELPSVGTSADGGAKKIVSFKYHMGKNSESVKAAVARASDAVLGAGQYLLQGIGQ